MDVNLLGCGIEHLELSTIVQALKARSYDGELIDEAGTIFLGSRQPAFPGEERWFHTIYRPGLSEFEYASLERDLGLSIWNPKNVLQEGQIVSTRREWACNTPYHGLLQYLNGGRFFAGHVNFFGVRRNNPWESSQPLELASENPFKTVNEGAGRLLIFGGYRWDGSLLACAEGEPYVLRYSRDGVIRNRWPSLARYLGEEFERLNSLFDSAGYLLNPDTSTAPISGEGK